MIDGSGTTRGLRESNNREKKRNERMDRQNEAERKVRERTKRKTDSETELTKQRKN